jgi:hypothetical protein
MSVDYLCKLVCSKNEAGVAAFLTENGAKLDVNALHHAVDS